MDPSELAPDADERHRAELERQVIHWSEKVFERYPSNVPGTYTLRLDDGRMLDLPREETLLEDGMSISRVPFQGIAIDGIPDNMLQIGTKLGEESGGIGTRWYVFKDGRLKTLDPLSAEDIDFENRSIGKQEPPLPSITELEWLVDTLRAKANS